MKYSLILMGLLYFSVLAFAQPVIKVENPSFDFGNIKEGEIAKHNFVISNQGDQDLQIQKVISSCGCTSGTGAEQVIAPQEKGNVEVSFDSTGFSGAQVKMVRVYSNDPETIEAILTLRGQVSSAITANPTVVSFNPDRDQQTERQVKVKVDQAFGIKIVSIESFSKNFEILNLTGSELEKSFTVKLNPDLAIGDYRDRVVVNLSGAKATSKNIPVIIKITGGIQVSPPTVSFGVISEGATLERVIKVQTQKDKNIKLLSAESDFEGLVVEIMEVKDFGYHLKFKLDPEQLNVDQLRTKVLLSFDNPEYPPITVNVHGIKLSEVK